MGIGLALGEVLREVSRFVGLPLFTHNKASGIDRLPFVFLARK